MEVNDLTTGDQDPQVNSEEQDNLNTNEVMVDESQDESTNVDGSLSNEPNTNKEYDDAWDNIDINDDSAFEKMTSTNEEVIAGSADPLNTDTSTTQGTNNNIGAFMVDKPVLKYKGKDIPIDSEAELVALAQKGFSYETEMANMKPKKKALSIIDNVPLEVLQAVADIHNGNKDAIGYIKSQYGIEDVQSTNTDDLWGESDKEEVTKQDEPTYTPKVAVDNPIEDFWAKYSSENKQSAGKVSDTYDALDESFKAEIYTPEIFPAFTQSVASGEFDLAYPIAIKEKSLNPAMTWLQAYQVAVSKIGQPPVKQTEPPASATPPANTNTGSRNVSSEAMADKVWEDDAYFKELESKLFG